MYITLIKSPSQKSWSRKEMDTFSSNVVPEATQDIFGKSDSLSSDVPLWSVWLSTIIVSLAFIIGLPRESSFLFCIEFHVCLLNEQGKHIISLEFLSNGNSHVWAWHRLWSFNFLFKMTGISQYPFTFRKTLLFSFTLKYSNAYIPGRVICQKKSSKVNLMDIK